MSGVLTAQYRLLRIGLLALACAGLMRVAMWVGVAEPLAFILGVVPIVLLAVAERLFQKNWSKGAAVSIAVIFGPASFFPLNTLYPNGVTELLLWPAAIGMLFGFAFVLWSTFMRPVRPISE